MQPGNCFTYGDRVVDVPATFADSTHTPDEFVIEWPHRGLQTTCASSCTDPAEGRELRVPDQVDPKFLGADLHRKKRLFVSLPSHCVNDAYASAYLLSVCIRSMSPARSGAVTISFSKRVLESTGHTHFRTLEHPKKLFPRSSRSFQARNAIGAEYEACRHFRAEILMFARATAHIGLLSACVASVVLRNGVPLALGMPNVDRFKPHIPWRRRA